MTKIAVQKTIARPGLACVGVDATVLSDGSR